MINSYPLLYFFKLAAFPTDLVKQIPDRIVGGEDVAQGELPYQISLRYFNSHICGGSLVVVENIQVIVTAAHCVTSGTPRQYKVVAGDVSISDHSGLEQTRQVKAIYAHKNYNSVTFANDIAILFITEPFQTNGDVQPIPLPPKGKRTKGDIIVSGWGTTMSSGTLPDVLQQVQIPVISDKLCQEAYPRETILPSMLCAGLLGEGGKDSCQGILKNLIKLTCKTWLHYWAF